MYKKLPIILGHRSLETGRVQQLVEPLDICLYHPWCRPQTLIVYSDCHVDWQYFFGPWFAQLYQIHQRPCYCWHYYYFALVISVYSNVVRKLLITYYLTSTMMCCFLTPIRLLSIFVWKMFCPAELASLSPASVCLCLRQWSLCQPFPIRFII